MVSFFSSYTSDLACCPIFVTLGLECIARYTKVREVEKAAAVQLLLVLPWLHPIMLCNTQEYCYTYCGSHLTPDLCSLGMRLTYTNGATMFYGLGMCVQSCTAWE